MVGDSEVDAASAIAKLPFVLVKGGYTENDKEIKHDVLISDFNEFGKIIEKFL